MQRRTLLTTTLAAALGATGFVAPSRGNTVAHSERPP